MITREDIRLWRLAKQKPGPYCLNRILYVRDDGWRQVLKNMKKHDYSKFEPHQIKAHLRMFQEWAQRTKEIQQEFMKEFIK